MCVGNLIYVMQYHKIYILGNIGKIMREEEHKEAFESHKKTIFGWAIEIQGLQNSQRIIGLHASRGIIELLSRYLHGKKLVKAGFQLNHRWFKSNKVYDKLPDFDNKEIILNSMIKLENICEKLSYGKSRQIEEIKLAVTLFNELEETINNLK